MKRILLPTDFSLSAHNAIEYAIGLFSDEKVEFILLNVWSEPHNTATISLSPLMDVLEKDSMNGLNNELQNLQTSFPDQQISIRSEYGRLQGVVEKIVEHDAIEMVVMGTKGASGIAKFLMGSNTADIVENVKCPVMAVPENAKFKSPKRIAFATDHKKFKNSEVVTTLNEMVQQYGTELLIVHINKKDKVDSDMVRSGEKYLGEVFKGVPHDIHSISSNDITEGLNTFAQSHDIDMLVLVAHEYNYLEGLFRSSESKNMAMVSKVPLLVLHDR